MTSPTINFQNRKDKKEESFLDKIGTIGRRKKTKEIQDLSEEGRNAIEFPSSPGMFEMGPEYFMLEDNEERSMVDPISRQDPKVKQLIQVLIDWINDELAVYRILVKDLEEDLFDGQILQKLIEKLGNIKVEVPEVTQSEIGQKHKLKEVLHAVNEVLNIPTWNEQQWSVDRIHSKDLVAILSLLVTLVRAFKPPIKLPENVVIYLVVVQKRDGILNTMRTGMQITSLNEDVGSHFERDAFDTLFDHAPDKLNVVKKSLVNFVNKHLSKINLEVTDLDTQFYDGVFLVLLMGLLEGYFVPLYNFVLTPSTFEQKVSNVNLAFELMVNAGIPNPKARAENIVNMDLKSILRILYNLFTKYKNIS